MSLNIPNNIRHDVKDLKAKKDKGYIMQLISQGEHVQQDFKYAISDARKIARSISAFANNSGGRLLVGVKDNGTIAGVRNEEDIYVIEQAASMYCRPPQQVEFTAFSTGATGVVIRASVPRADTRPVQAQEPDKSWRAYYRVDDENIQAHPLMVRAWRRMASGRSSHFHIDGPESLILEAIRQRGSLPVDEAYKVSGASRGLTENAIVRLAAMGVVDFVHTSGTFNLVNNT